MPRVILVISGSPRLGGNSDLLADAFIEGAVEKGHIVHKVNLAAQKINGCLGCNLCHTTDQPCIQNDDMLKVYEQFQEADTVVFATPLYFWSFPAQMKAVIDRLYAVGYLSNFDYPSKDCALLVTAADNSKNTFTQIVDYYQSNMIKHLRWHDLGMVLAGGVSEKGDIIQTIHLHEAKRLGTNL